MRNEFYKIVLKDPETYNVFSEEIKCTFECAKNFAIQQIFTTAIINKRYNFCCTIVKVKFDPINGNYYPVRERNNKYYFCQHIDKSFLNKSYEQISKELIF